MFTAAADVLWRIGEEGRVIQEFVDLGAKAKVAASEAMDAEAALGEIPDEFLDPIQVRFFFPFPAHRMLPFYLIFLVGKSFIPVFYLRKILMVFFPLLLAVHFNEGSSDLTFFQNHN